MKIAAVFTRPRDSGQAIGSMLEAQRLRQWHTSGRLPVSGGHAGYVQTSDQSGVVPLLRQALNGTWLAVTGVPIDCAGSLDAKLAACLTLPFDAALAQLQQLDGAFAALYWDAGVSKLGIVTDILGMQPLHMLRENGLLALSTDVKAITGARLASGEMDPAGWGGFLSVKHPIAGRTMVQSIERVPAAAVLVYEPATDTLRSRSYWRWPELRTAPLAEQPVREIVDVFLAELQAFPEHNRHATLLLSGGFDSRFVLAGLAKLGKTPDTMCLSHADELFDTDARIAARLARVFGSRFTLHDSDPNFFSSSAYTDYLAANEVATPSLYLFIAQLCSKLKPEMQAVWEGVFPGCIIHPVHQPPGGFENYLRRECQPTDSVAWQGANRIFRADLVQHMREAFRNCLAEEKARYPDNEFGVSQFVVRNRTRHRIAVNPLQVYSNDVLPFTPGISKAFWSLTAAIPYEIRAEHRLYRHIFREFFPKAMDVPAVSGTTPYRMNRTADFDYILARIGVLAMQRPKVAAVMRLAGFGEQQPYWTPSRLVDEAISDTDTHHPDLTPSGVEKIRSAQPPYDPVTAKARELLFYWSWWRRMLAGDVRGTMHVNQAHR